MGARLRQLLRLGQMSVLVATLVNFNLPKGVLSIVVPPLKNFLTSLPISCRPTQIVQLKEIQKPLFLF